MGIQVISERERHSCAVFAHGSTVAGWILKRLAHGSTSQSRVLEDVRAPAIQLIAQVPMRMYRFHASWRGAIGRSVTCASPTRSSLWWLETPTVGIVWREWLLLSMIVQACFGK